MLYEAWIDSLIDDLLVVAALMDTVTSAEELDAAFQDQRGRWDGRDLMMSITGTPKLEDLFGTPDRFISHGATQFPWYEAVFQAWKQNQPIAPS